MCEQIHQNGPSSSHTPWRILHTGQPDWRESFTHILKHKGYLDGHIPFPPSNCAQPVVFLWPKLCFPFRASGYETVSIISFNLGSFSSYSSEETVDEDTFPSLVVSESESCSLLELLLLPPKQPIPPSVSQFLSQLKIQQCLINVFMTYIKRMAIKPPPQADSLIVLKQRHLNILHIMLWWVYRGIQD